PGTYNFTYTVADGCGNAASCDVTVTVRDAKPPTAYCNNGIVITLMPTGMVDIWAIDFNAGSFDNCTEQDDLQYRISLSGGAADEVPTTTSLTFNCDNIGTNAVRIWVVDNDGNWSFCETFVQVQDPNSACAGFGGGANIVGGLIRNSNGEAVEDVVIRMNGGSTFQPFTTGVDGTYLFENVREGSDYTIAPEKTINTRNGVTTFDQVLILKHILENRRLDSPYKMIAADVNRSGTITNADMVAIRKLILSIEDNFSNNNSWRFIDADYQFYSDSPMNENFPEVYSINNFGNDMPGVNFMAIKVGDVNDSALPNALLGSDERNNPTVGTLQLNTENRLVQAGEEVTVTLRANEMTQLLGYQFTIDFETTNLEFIDVENADLAGISKANFGFTSVAEGIITTNFAQANTATLNEKDGLFTLKFRALQTAQLSDILQVNSRQIDAEAYDENLELLDVQLTFDNQIQENTYALYQNQPNPFSTQTTVDFYLPTATNAILRIYDINGRLLKVYSSDFVAGKNSFQINKADINRNGTLYYQLQTAEYTATRKMILLE
ncbi:MAG: cohesin domain-containing protein, partial [Saprospiraceae bacterium]